MFKIFFSSSLIAEQNKLARLSLPCFKAMREFSLPLIEVFG